MFYCLREYCFHFITAWMIYNQWSYIHKNVFCLNVSCSIVIIAFWCNGMLHPASVPLEKSPHQHWDEQSQDCCVVFLHISLQPRIMIVSLSYWEARCTMIDGSVRNFMEFPFSNTLVQVKVIFVYWFVALTRHDRNDRRSSQKILFIGDEGETPYV